MDGGSAFVAGIVTVSAAAGFIDFGRSVQAERRSQSRTGDDFFFAVGTKFFD